LRRSKDGILFRQHYGPLPKHSVLLREKPMTEPRRAHWKRTHFLLNVPAMIDLPLFLAFIAAVTVFIVTPGMDTAVVLRTAAVDGSLSAFAAAAGILLGCLTWGSAVSLGLGALLEASELAYTLVKWAGALYLLWVGIQLLLRPRTTIARAEDAPPKKWTAAFRRGFLTNILNPKVGVFYVTFIPQFIPHGVNVTGYSFFLTTVQVLLGVLWFTLLIAATVPLGRLLRRPDVVKVMDRLTGLVFIAFGIKLATSSAGR